MSGVYTVIETVTLTCIPVSRTTYQVITWLIYLQNRTNWTVSGGGLGTTSNDPEIQCRRKVRHYMFAYLEGLPGGSDLEELVKLYKKEFLSHTEEYQSTSN